MDSRYSGDWPTLWGGTSTALRSVFLGDPAAPDSGVVELVEMDDLAPAPPRPPGPTVGFLLVSLFADLDEVLPRLAALGVGGAPRLITVYSVRLAVVEDPNGVRVELMDLPARQGLAGGAGGSG